jgi:hypothetical protein
MRFWSTEATSKVSFWGLLACVGQAASLSHCALKMLS